MINTLNRLLRPLRGTNLEVFKFGMYLLFPIGWMYYFGTNLENRFSVDGFWPTQEQSHRIPYEREEIKAEVERIQREMRRRRSEREEEGREALGRAREAFRSTSSAAVTTATEGADGDRESRIEEVDAAGRGESRTAQ